MTTSETPSACRRRSLRQKSSARWSSRAGLARRAPTSRAGFRASTRAVRRRSAASVSASSTRLHSSSSPEGEYLGRGVRGSSCGLSRAAASSISPATPCAFGDSGSHPAASTSPTTRCCRSATISRWDRREAALALELLGNPACVPWPLRYLPDADTGLPSSSHARRPRRSSIGWEPGEVLELG